MRILFATSHTYLPQRVGGSEASTHDLCNELIRLGHEVAVMASLSSEGAFGLRCRVYRKVLRRACSKDNVLGYPVYRGGGLKKGVPEVARRFVPEVVVLQSGQPVPFADAFLAEGVPAVIYLRDVEFHDAGGIYEMREGIRYIANSRFTAERAKIEFGIDATVIPPLVRPDQYRTVTDRSNVLFVNPHPVKGADMAFALAEKLPGIPFVFLECWSLPDKVRKEYRARAVRCGNVTWREKVLDMREIYKRAKIVIVPSQWDEAWGRVATEAQASGIPVIASAVGGLPESVGSGGILISPAGTVEEWKTAIQLLWSNEDAYKALATAALQHSQRAEILPDTLIHRFVDVLQNSVKDMATSPAQREAVYRPT